MAIKRDREDEKDRLTLDLVSSLMMLSNVKKQNTTYSNRAYVCKTCNREFSSFQALGGHRASHNKEKLVVENGASSPVKAKAHECPICRVEFPLGQALGGHMRRHRDFMASAAAERAREAAVPVLKKSNSSKRVMSGLNLDLNLAPPGEHYDLTKLQLMI